MKITKFKTTSMKLILMVSILTLIFSLLPVQSLAAEEIIQNDNIFSEDEIIVEDRAVGFIIKLLAKKKIKEAAELYGKQAVKDAIINSLPKTISGKELVKTLEKFGFEKVRHNGTSHVKMKGPNGKIVTIPLHNEIAKGTYSSIKRQIKDSI